MGRLQEKNKNKINLYSRTNCICGTGKPGPFIVVLGFLGPNYWICLWYNLKCHALKKKKKRKRRRRLVVRSYLWDLGCNLYLKNVFTVSH